MNILMILGSFFVAVFILSCFWAIFLLIVQAKDDIARVLRMLAAGFGFLCFFGARALDLTIPGLILKSAGVTGELAHSLISVVFPAFIGGVMSYVLFKSVGRIFKGNERSIYLLISLTTLVAFISLDSFLEAIGSKAAPPSLLPNVSFIIGVLVTMLFGLNLPEILKDAIEKPKQSKTKGNYEGWKSDM